MKHLLLSILMVFAIGMSLPSATAVNAQGNQIDFDYEVMATAPDSGADSINAIKPGIIPPIEPLDVKRLYLRNYFNGLTENFPKNLKGSCTFVALAMLLSYYDSYICDEIVPEECDVPSTGNSYDIIGRNNSPGVLYDYISDEELMEYYRYESIDYLTPNNAYYSLQRKYGTKSFQYVLVDLARKNNLINLNASYQTNMGLSYSNVPKLINEYLCYSLKFTEEDFVLSSYHGEYTEEFKQYLKSNIDSGNPVYVIAYEPDGILPAGHAFICYDYDNDDKFYTHLGWHTYAFGEGFKIYSRGITAYALDFKIEHSCSNNYMVGDKAYCYCDEAIETYHNHNYETCLNYSKQYHRTYCKCGKYKQSPHWVKGPLSGKYMNCGGCGATVEIGGDIIIGVLSLSKTPNGSYISQNGIPVIMEGDVEAYLNGTLKFGSGLGNYDYI